MGNEVSAEATCFSFNLKYSSKPRVPVYQLEVAYPRVGPSWCLIDLGNSRSIVESTKVQTKMKKEIDGWGLANSIVYATGLIKKAEVVTGDEHFRKLKSVVFIK